MSKMIVGLGKDGEKQEAEITPEMIEAGLMEFLEYDPDCGASARDIVVEVYLAMHRARSIRPIPNGRPGATETDLDF